MRIYRQNLYPNLLRTGYELRSFLPLIYFTICYTILSLISGIVQIIIAGSISVMGVVLLVLYVSRSQSDITSNNWRSIHTFGILCIVSLTAVLVLYSTGTAFIPFGSALLSTIGLTAVSRDITQLKKLVVKLYPDGVKLYNVAYPFYSQFIYAITHNRKEYGNLDSDQKINDILLTISTEHEIGFVTFNSGEEYAEWLDDSRTIMACEMCYKDEECVGGDTKLKGIYASNFDPVRISICKECQNKITKKLITEGTIDSGTVAASMI